MELMLELWSVFLKIGLFSFGGGYAMLPLIQNEVMLKRSWLVADEFINVVALSQMTPGPIAINSSTFVGMKTAGFVGAFFATLGVVTGSFLLVLFVASRLEKVKSTHVLEWMFLGLRPAVLGLILSAAWQVSKTAVVSFKDLVILVVTFVMFNRFKGHPVFYIVGAGLLGTWIY